MDVRSGLTGIPIQFEQARFPGLARPAKASYYMRKTCESFRSLRRLPRESETTQIAPAAATVEATNAVGFSRQFSVLKPRYRRFGAEKVCFEFPIPHHFLPGIP